MNFLNSKFDSDEDDEDYVPDEGISKNELNNIL